MGKLIKLLLLLFVMLISWQCRTKKINIRYTFHKLTDGKVLIIDQETGKTIKYEYSTTSFSPGSIIDLGIDWSEIKEK